MITGVHSIIYSTDPQADMAFFKDILKFNNVDAGHGWLIFGLPPSELAIHPADENGKQEFYLITDDIHLFVKEMNEHKVNCTEVETHRWGLLTHLTLPSGSKLDVYEPKHARP